MEVQELRIGNLVNHEQTTHVIKSVGGDRVSSVSIRGKDDDTYNSSIKHIKPIPLTEEWLMRFGFYYAADYYTICINPNEPDGFKFFHSVNYKNENWKYHNDEDDSSSSVIAEIKYIHQLQNLYFALTGEELVLNDK